MLDFVGDAVCSIPRLSAASASPFIDSPIKNASVFLAD
jgi:hypothetical protein